MSECALRRRCILRRMWLAAAVLSVVVLPTNLMAEVCSASGTLANLPLTIAGTTCTVGMQPGDPIQFNIIVTNYCTTTLGDPVDARLTGTTVITETCDSAAIPCPLSFPNALTFNGCPAPTPAGVICSSGDANTVNIDLPAGGIPLVAGGSALVARLEFVANVPVDTADCGIFFTRSTTGFTDLTTNDDRCDVQVSSGAAGITYLFFPECIHDSDCDDELVCNGDELCDQNGQCEPGNPLDCDDGNACTDDSCHEPTGCVSTPIDPEVDCDDGDICTLNECDPQVGCVNPPIDDGDGDGVGECGGDCDDNDPTTYPDAPETNDGLDNQCPGDDGFGIVDEVSGDAGFHNPSDPNEYSWPVQNGALSYLVARSSAPDFSGGCITFPSAASFVIDPDIPSSETIFHYLVRSETPNRGSWGNSAGGERSFICGSETLCNDGYDNDADGQADCGDTDCFGQPGCTTESRSTQMPRPPRSQRGRRGEGTEP